MPPLVVVFVCFGLLFVVLASLAQGLAVTKQTFGAPLRTHVQLDVMLLISTFIIVPTILIGLAAIVNFADQVKMAIVVLALCGGAPFVPWIVSLAKGNVGYSAAATTLLLIATLIVLPLAVPPLERALVDSGTANITTWHLAWPLLVFMVVPFVIGVIIRARWPSLMMALAPWLGPLSITFLVIHIVLFVSYSWDVFVGIAGYGQIAFALVFPIVGMLVGYLLSPPYVLSPVKPADPHRGTKLVSVVSVAQQNTGAVICCAVFAFGAEAVAGSYMLLGAIATIIVVVAVMAEVGAKYEKHHRLAPAAPAATSASHVVATHVIADDDAAPSSVAVPRQHAHA
jgi:bile acid:Na+ symporter, BASS family